MFVRNLSHPTMSSVLSVLALLLSFVTGTRSFSFQSHTTFRTRGVVNNNAAAAAAAAVNTKLRMATNNNNNIVVRDWKDGDEAGIRRLLSSAGSFDPEGPLDIDCGGPQALRESYDPDDGGCFLVATTTTFTDQNGSESILGTAGLIVGTQIQYLKSGASMVTPQKVTGAVRRVCCRASGQQQQQQQQSSILRALLMKLEARALEQQATELIILAYPETNTATTTSIARPTSALLEDIGYQSLPINLGGIDAKQYCKQLDRENLQKRETSAENDASLDNTKKQEESSTGMVMDTAIVGGVLTFLLIAILGIANLLGLAVSSSGIDNGGIGAPLSSQELQRLQQDEALKRTDLDAGVGGGGERQWSDLNSEELREEAALMKIIQGETVRLQ
jgi:hypothetical protein